MPLKQGVGHKSLAAVLALVRPLTRMVPQMQDQGCPLRETSTALRAHVRLVARVRPLVDAQVLLAGEPLVAFVTLENPFVRVIAFVYRQPFHRR